MIRASKTDVRCHKWEADFLCALNEETVTLHKNSITEKTVIIYDSDAVNEAALPTQIKSVGIPLGSIIKDEKANEIMRNTGIVAALFKAAGLAWDDLEAAFRSHILAEIDLNIKVARRAYDAGAVTATVDRVSDKRLPLMTGNEGLSLGLLKGGLEGYISYPMTPTSPVLHFLAAISKDIPVKVIHPESELAVMLMALGFSTAGKRVAVGTSGGGFCLMVEGLSCSGMAELPVVVVLGQRPGPGTGLPTYSTQAELLFALHAGHGEFIRFVVAPGDPEEASYLAQMALDISWRYQIPSIILTDKDMGEGTFTVENLPDYKAAGPRLWDRNGQYKRYMDTPDGVSPLAFPGDKEATVKINSYEHDEYGITTESPALTIKMQDKRLRKERALVEELSRHELISIYGDRDSDKALIVWGSNKWVGRDVAASLNLRFIQVKAMAPFPVKQFGEALKGVKKRIIVENNATGQLESVLKNHGFNMDRSIHRYDGRPYTFTELRDRVAEALK